MPSDATSRASIRCRTAPGNFDNYTSTVNRDVTDNVFSGRIDHRVSDKDSFFVRFNWGKFKLDAPQGQAACCLPTPAEAAARFDLGPFVAGIQNTRLTTHGAAFNYSKMLSATFVNELRAGYAQTSPFTFQSDFGIQRRRLARHSRHQRHRVHDRPPEHQRRGPDGHFRRARVPAGEPEAVPLAGRRRARLAERAAPAEVRIPAGRSLPVAVHQHRYAGHHQPSVGTTRTTR